MRDESLIEPFAAQEIYCDGFTDHKVRNGIMSCAAFRYQEPARDGEPILKVVVVRLVFPKDCVPAALADTQAAITASEPAPRLWLRKAH